MGNVCLSLQHNQSTTSSFLYKHIFRPSKMNQSFPYRHGDMKFSSSQCLTFDQSNIRENGYGHTHLSRLAMLLRFFTFHWDRRLVPNPTVIYLGAAPGFHVFEVSKLLSSVHFHLYDVKGFGIRDKANRVTIHHQPMTGEELNGFKERDDIYFISELCRDGEDETNREIMKLQEECMRVLNPHQSLLVISFPPCNKYSPGKTLAEEEQNALRHAAEMNNYTYCDGIIYNRVFSPTNSRLLELVPNDGQRSYNLRACQNGINYFYQVMKMKVFDMPDREAVDADAVRSNALLNGSYDFTTLLYIIYKYHVKFVFVYRNHLYEKRRTLKLAKNFIRRLYYINL